MSTVTLTDELMGEYEVAKFLGEHVRRVQFLRRTGALPHIRVARKCVKYRKVDVESWLNSRYSASKRNEVREVASAAA